VDDSFSFWKNLILVIVFLTVTPLALAASLYSLVSLNNNPPQTLLSTSPSGLQVYASLPTDLPTVSSQVEASDARIEIIRQYLDDYGSPLLPFAEKLVSSADKYGIDYRLTTAIAQKESNLCKITPPKCFNCWGWGIHSEGTMCFANYNEAIEEVTRGLFEEYFQKGYDTVEKIMTKYTPLSNGSWALGVNQFLSEME
jgi:hypothetical protein